MTPTGLVGSKIRNLHWLDKTTSQRRVTQSLDGADPVIVGVIGSLF
jgi:hypothetical protein